MSAKNIIVTIGSERLYFHGAGLSYGSGSDILALMQTAVRVGHKANWRDTTIPVAEDQGINIELTTDELQPGEVAENATAKKLETTEAARDQYSKWWLEEKAKVEAEKKRANELQAKLDAINAAVSEEPL